ncbi:hypothetical protein SAMD00019534_025880 [Acytostelium subglobosum LB1]|uniref:hypothetical protein n=1 Tax=Acytostelium subglobosum LB1 TaxID=1410327 RepID=UPI000644C27D|nr:hypothetical protein SAMD00019534_025880 [Acytostelium subglobosum LB1]GAM19413.1 hypothetical protein SAMD00019534_025880 [Acytostelium subglobosum LB1]|eukprot:XP_012757340.1 hypothetical protein SAMD00019534_025880 [Acytostelium subglobosum LB1]
MFGATITTTNKEMVKEKKDEKEVKDVGKAFGRCNKHDKKLQFLCLDDNDMICSGCVSSKHFGHKIANSDYMANKEAPIVVEHTKRLNYVWTTMKGLAKAHHEFTDQEKVIHQLFHNLHEALTLEEHKLIKPLTTNIEATEATLEKAIKEVNSLLLLVGLPNQSDTNSCWWESFIHQESEVKEDEDKVKIVVDEKEATESLEEDDSEEIPKWRKLIECIKIQMNQRFGSICSNIIL